jgi:hypothetical protein
LKRVDRTSEDTLLGFLFRSHELAIHNGRNSRKCALTGVDFHHHSDFGFSFKVSSGPSGGGLVLDWVRWKLDKVPVEMGGARGGDECGHRALSMTIPQNWCEIGSGTISYRGISYLGLPVVQQTGVFRLIRPIYFDLAHAWNSLT